MSYSTRPEQALLYRLSGDRNPLHSDPQFASAAGLPQPILHGLCVFGFAGRALLNVIDGDPARFGHMSARFAAPVTPGSDLDVHIWTLGDGAFSFEVFSAQRTVLGRGTFTEAP